MPQRLKQNTSLRTVYVICTVEDSSLYRILSTRNTRNYPGLPGFKIFGTRNALGNTKVQIANQPRKAQIANRREKNANHPFFFNQDLLKTKKKRQIFAWVYSTHTFNSILQPSASTACDLHFIL